MQHVGHDASQLLRQHPVVVPLLQPEQQKPRVLLSDKEEPLVCCRFNQSTVFVRPKFPPPLLKLTSHKRTMSQPYLLCEPGEQEPGLQSGRLPVAVADRDHDRLRQFLPVRAFHHRQSCQKKRSFVSFKSGSETAWSNSYRRSWTRQGTCHDTAKTAP